MVDNKKQGIEKLLQTTVAVLSIAIIGVMFFTVKAIFFGTSTAPRTSIEKQLVDSQNALNKNPNDVQARMMLAFTYGQTGEYKKAEHEYLQVLKLDKKNTKAYYLLALNYENMNDVKKAIETFMKIEDYEPALYSIGRLKYAQKKYNEAISYLNKALKLEATGSDTLYYLGLCYEKLGNKKEAIKNYKAALQYTPDFVIAKKALKRIDR